MKKIMCILLSLMLLVTMAAPVRAEETPAPQNEGNTVHEGGSQEGGSQEDGSQEGGNQEDGSQQDVPHEHSWTETNTATCETAGTLTKSCACGVSESVPSAAKGHNWDAGKLTREANCQQEGEMTYTCANCSGTKTEKLPMESTHDYSEWTTTATAHRRVCDDCLVQDSGSHSWKEEITQKPTCKEAGSKKVYCTVCNYGGGETIALPQLTTHTYDSACDAVCNVCEKEREIEHTFTKVWSKSYKGHWHECTKCGAEADFAKHIPGPAATEEKEQVCLTCGYVVMPKKNHGHSYGSEWTNDEVGHWHACTGCKEEKDYASHSFDDDCDSDCNTCGYKRENSHTYDQEGWQVSNFDHWNICSVCGEESKHEKHVPGPEATDEAAQVCTVCGYELSPILDHTHDFGTEYVKAKDSHWLECACGELSVPESHAWDKGKENRDDTITFTCTVCGAEKTEAAPSSGFPWLTVLLVILAMICVGGIVVLVILLKRGTFEEEADEEEEVPEEMDDVDGDTDSDEEQLIDDFFASLDEELYK